MKKGKIAMAAGTIILVLSACGVTGEPEELRSDLAGVPVESTDGAGRGQETSGNGGAGSESGNLAEGKEGQQTMAGNGSAGSESGSLAESKEGQQTMAGNGDAGSESGSPAESKEGQQTMAGNGDVPGNQAVENADTEATAEALLDLFINGSISAADPTDTSSAFYITELKMGSEEWDSFSIGEKVDLDNDGEDELVLNGPYGGIYLDARDNKVYEFASPGGTALTLSYTYYNGAVWIMYSNRSSGGFEFYHMEKYEGAGNLAAEMNFGEEFDVNHPEAGVKYTLNGAEISYDEYTALCSKIFAAEVSTEQTSG